jgi:hypothetical protein
MSRDLITWAAALLTLATGCGRGDTERSISSVHAEVHPFAGDGGAPLDGLSVVVASADGTWQEEVVTLDGGLPAADERRDARVPAIVLEALAAAPSDGRSDEPVLPSNVSLIVSSPDGAVQEEVVLVDHVEPEPAQAFATGEVLVAALTVPAT